MCEYCGNNSFAELNLSDSFFGRIKSLNIHIDNKGVTRLCAYDKHDILMDEMVLTVNYCPMCGRKFEWN